MKLYDCYGNMKNYELSARFNYGGCGDIYFCNYDEVLKIYYHTCSDKNRLKKYTYDIIRELNNTHIASVNELLFENQINEIFLDENDIFKKYSIDAYTCEYIKPDDLDILTTPTNYILENMYEISKILSYFASKNVKAYDMKASNTILQNDKMVLIDLDCWRRVDIEEFALNKINQRMLITLLQSLFSDDIDKKYYAIKKSGTYESTLYQLFYELQLSGENKFKLIYDFFSGYKYPIDAIKEYKKNRF